MKKIQDVKARAWTFIVYEDSTDIADFEANIKDLGRIGLRALYIRHDQDKQDDGSIKKTHWHVIIIWENTTTYKTAIDVAQNIADVSYIEPIRSLVGASRYLTHMDDADKYQYDKSDVICVGDVDYSEVIASSRNDRIELNAMISYIRENGVIHFDEFSYYCLSENPEWLRILTERNTFYFKNLIQAQYFRLKEEEDKKREKEYKNLQNRSKNTVKKFKTKHIDIVTGEILFDEAE